MQRRTFLKLLAVLPALSTGFAIVNPNYAQANQRSKTVRLTSTGYGMGSYSQGSYPTPATAPNGLTLYLPFAHK